MNLNSMQDNFLLILKVNKSFFFFKKKFKKRIKNYEKLPFFMKKSIFL